MCQDRKLYIIDRTAIFVLRLLLELLFPTLLDKIHFRLQPEVFLRDPANGKPARVAHLHALLHFGLCETHLGEGRAERGAERQFLSELVLCMDAA